MSGNYWVKLHIDTLDDPKISTLPDNLYRRYIELYVLCGEHQGQLPDLWEIAWKLRQDKDDLEVEMVALAGRGLLQKPANGPWSIVRFEKEQLVDYGWSPLKKYIFDRDKVCVYCGKIPEHLDHIIPRAKGGQDEKTNTVAACAKCNQSKKDKDMFDWFVSQSFFNPERLAYIGKVIKNG